MKLGILGGTFDPIHLGHLLIGEETRLRLSLEELCFIPSGQPWLKAERQVTPGPHRLEMVRRAIAGNPYFRVSTLELERPGPSYMVETLRALREEMGAGAELFLLMGLDALADLPLWHEPARLLTLCRVVALGRPGVSPPWSALEAALPGSRARIQLLDAPLIEVSSSQIRERVRQGLSIRYLVPEAVERYIQEHRLYRA